jgi:ferredoxin-NADP reductase
MAFEVERPADFTFEAGQFVGVRLPDLELPADGSDDGERMLSIASAPHDDHLMIALRMRDSAFKQHLARAPVGEQGVQVELSPAMGELVLPQECPQGIVMIAGGIGITPFYSMLRHLWHRRSLGHVVPQITLLFANRNKTATVWQEELNAIARDAKFLRVVHVWDDPAATASDHGGWSTRTGLITDSLIRAEVPDWASRHYYIVGPTGMVAAMQDCLDAMAVPSEQVFIEFFAGY